MSAHADIDDLRGMVRMLSDRVADLEARLNKLTRPPAGDHGPVDEDGVPLNDGNAIGMLYDKIEENRRLADRVAALEARLAMMTAAMTMRPGAPPDDDQPTIIHDVAPNAPR